MPASVALRGRFGSGQAKEAGIERCGRQRRDQPVPFVKPEPQRCQRRRLQQAKRRHERAYMRMRPVALQHDKRRCTEVIVKIANKRPLDKTELCRRWADQKNMDRLGLICL